MSSTTCPFETNTSAAIPASLIRCLPFNEEMANPRKAHTVTSVFGFSGRFSGGFSKDPCPQLLVPFEANTSAATTASL
jgi:hypothetical protein